LKGDLGDAERFEKMKEGEGISWVKTELSKLLQASSGFIR
jgi:hypothetical protein